MNPRTPIEAPTIAISVWTRMYRWVRPGLATERFRLDSARFPAATRDLLTIDEILELGVLALGYKERRGWSGSRRMLNLGFLAPPRFGEQRAWAESLGARAGAVPIEGTQVYLVAPDEFVEVLKRSYGMTEPGLLERPQLHPILRAHLTAPAPEGT